MVNFKNGAVLRCPISGSIYVIDKGKKRKFPNITVYRSWGRPSFKEVSCNLLKQIPNGPELPLLTSGMNLKCSTTGAIYEIQDGKKHWYPTSQIYKSWGSPSYQTLSCPLLDLIPNGSNKPLKSAPRSPQPKGHPPPAPPPAPTPTVSTSAPPAPSTPSPTVILIFTGTTYTGSWKLIPGPTEVIDLSLLGFPDNQLNSIKVGSQVNVKLYADTHLKNFIQEIDGPAKIANLANNQVSSLAIVRKNQSGITRLDQVASTNFWLILLLLLILILVFFYYRSSTKE